MKNGPLDKLFELVRVLRGKNGCPWDRAQKVEDILSDLIEETYELQWAEAHDSQQDVLEEMGDVVFVLVFAMVLIEENDPSFTLERAANHAYDKIKRRHPHVFGDATAKNQVESLDHWNRVKMEEKRERPSPIPSFAGIPGNLPPIRRAEKIQQHAAKSGFDWPNTSGILKKIREEVEELEVAMNQRAEPDIREELGDLFFAIINLSRFLEVDGEEALTNANAKFARRFSTMEEFARRDGHQLKDLTLEEMDFYWERTKETE